VVRDSRRLALVLARFSSIASFGRSICNVLEGDGAFHILPRKYRLILPFHEDLDVGRHGGAVSACGLLFSAYSYSEGCLGDCDESRFK
jgi:hypothetical protein